MYEILFRPFVSVSTFHFPLFPSSFQSAHQQQTRKFHYQTRQLTNYVTQFQWRNRVTSFNESCEEGPQFQTLSYFISTIPSLILYINTKLECIFSKLKLHSVFFTQSWLGSQLPSIASFLLFHLTQELLLLLLLLPRNQRASQIPNQSQSHSQSPNQFQNQKLRFRQGVSDQDLLILRLI